MNTTLWITGIVVAITLGITFWAARQTKTTVQFYAADRKITGWQNGMAVAGDYMSAASFLGIAGLISYYGYDGFMYSVGWLVAYLTVLLLLAEPMRNTGKFTMADVLAFRMRPAPVRSAAAVSTLTVSGFYMIAQMVGAGSVLHLLIPSFPFRTAVIIVGILMIGYVVIGGMVATTWVQIVKASLLMTGAVLLSILVMAKFGFNPVRFFDAIAQVKDKKSGAELHPARHPLPARQDRTPWAARARQVGRRERLARDGPHLRHGRAATYPDALLHGAHRAGRAHVGRLGDGPDRQLLRDDDLPWVRGRRVRRQGKNPERQRRGA